jgi:hypothetical protein
MSLHQSLAALLLAKVLDSCDASQSCQGLVGETTVQVAQAKLSLHHVPSTTTDRLYAQLFTMHFTGAGSFAGAAQSVGMVTILPA